MKNWNWKQWTAFALAVLVVVGEVVLVFTQPWSALYVAIASVFTFIAGWLAGKHVEIKVDSDKKTK
jgi:hypothetical protein